MLRELVDSYAREYADLRGTWDNLEKKAQASVAVAGVFLGGVLSFARDVKHNTPVGDRVFASAVIVMMVFAIITAGRAMKVRTVLQPALGSNVAPMVEALLRNDAEDEQAEREANLLRDWRNMWEKTNSEVARLNKIKAGAVNLAQLLLLAATLVGAMWTLVAVFSA